MNIRRLFSLVFVMVMLLGITGPASANAPQPVGPEWCNIWLWYEIDNVWYPIIIEGQGQLVYNPRFEMYNLSCNANIDLTGNPSWAELCTVYPGTCKEKKMVINHLEVWHDFYEGSEYLYSYNGFATLNVNMNGGASWNAQFSPWNCDRGYITNAITMELPAGYWSEGTHTYTIDTYTALGTVTTYTVEFLVSADAPLYRGQVRLGLFEPTSFFMSVEAINPAQDTFMQATYWAPYQYANDMFDKGVFWVDEEDPITIEAGPIHNRCSDQHWSWYLRNYGPKY
jgi:hypothetical protein